MSAQATSRLTINLLGSMEVKQEGKVVAGLRQKSKWLLALLLLRQGKEIEYEVLGRLLWPDAPDRQPLDAKQVITSVRQCVSNLNTLLGSERFTKSSRSVIGIDLTEVEVDLFAFDAAASQEGDPAAWRRAVELYAGDLLTDCDEDWIQSERETRRQTYQRMLEFLAEHAQRQGDFGAAEKYLRLAIAVDRFKEANRCSLMRSLMRRGEYNAALDVYDQYRKLQHDPTRDAGPEMRRLWEAIRQKAAQERSRSARGEKTVPAAPAFRLPRPTRALIGREEAFDEITALFLFGRLVTLKGPPGIGKTHLALHVAAHLQSEYPDGVVFFDLSEVVGARDLWRVLASTLQIPDQPHQSAEEIVCSYLEMRQALLVLDNCEHLIHSGAGALREILQVCPYVRVLTTSRIAWDSLPGERVYTVPPLSLPAAALLKRLPADPLPELSAFSAVRLFLERVGEIHSRFALNAQNAGAVAQICHLLDGVPLAILLAAGWIQTLTPEQIRDRLAQGLELLRDARPSPAITQDRLMLTLDAGYQALPPTLQTLFRRLTVFHGGWTLQSAEAVCPLPNLLEGLRRLQECSLIEAEPDGAEMRFRLLGILRRFGERLLIQSAEAETMRRRHLDLCVQLAEAAEQELVSPQQEAALARLDREAENLAAALAYACESRETAQGLRIAGALWRFWSIRGHYQEGLDWLEKLLDQEPAEAGPVRSKALNGAGSLWYQRQEYAQARLRFQERLEFEEAQGVTLRCAGTLGNLASVASDLGDYAEARRLLERALALFRLLENPRGSAMIQANLAVVFCREGKLAEACALHEEAAAFFRSAQDWNNLAVSLNNIADIRISLQDRAGAAPCLIESLNIGRTLESRHVLVHCLSLSVFLLVQGNALEPAAQLLGATEAFIERTQSPLPPETQEEYRKQEAQLRAGLAAEVFQNARVRGSAMTLEETVAFACLALQALLAV